MEGVLFCGVARISSSSSSSDEKTPASTPEPVPDPDSDELDIAAAALASIPNSSSRFCRNFSCFRFSRRSDC